MRDPVIGSGPFHDAFAGNRSSWNPITISSLDTPNFAGVTLEGAGEWFVPLARLARALGAEIRIDPPAQTLSVIRNSGATATQDGVTGHVLQGSILAAQIADFRRSETLIFFPGCKCLKNLVGLPGEVPLKAIGDSGGKAITIPERNRSGVGDI